MSTATRSDDSPDAAKVRHMQSLHQYYRDALSADFTFPDLGDVPLELAEWAIRPDTVDTLKLAEFLLQIPNTRLPAEQDCAMRLMLFAILQANQSSVANNRYLGHIVPDGVAAAMREALARILALHRCYDYFVNGIQLLYRMNMIEDVLGFMKSQPELFEGSAVLRAIAGFIETSCGNFREGLRYLGPLAAGNGGRALPQVAALSHMTCEYRLGIVPEWPLRFDALEAEPARFDRELGMLPPMRMLQPLPADSQVPVVFVACDDAYFNEHARHLAYSLHRTNGAALALHLHLYSPGADTLAQVERLRAQLPGIAIGISAEDGPLPIQHRTTYYATARFVRAREALAHYRRDLCIVDADALFRLPWERLASLAGADAEVVLACPPVSPFWEQVLAGFVYCRDTPLGRDFLGEVAGFVLSNLVDGRAVWFTDQVALSVCADRMRDAGAIRRVDSALLVDMAHHDDALCWAVTTRKESHPAYNRAKEELARHYEKEASHVS
jgi:hypothetical protein